MKSPANCEKPAVKLCFTELLSIPSQAGVVWSVAFAPDDCSLAFGCGSTTKETGRVIALRAASEARMAAIK